MIPHQTIVQKGSNVDMSLPPLPIPLGFGVFAWLLATGLAAVLVFTYYDALAVLFTTWANDENYGHGPFIPLLSSYLIWLKRDEMLRKLSDRGSWWGLLLAGAGVVCYGVGEMAALYFMTHLSLWFMVTGAVVSAIGLKAARVIAFPLLYLLMAIPLPVFLHGELSGYLQMLSTALGVGCLQFIGVMAYRDGNVIDLGPIQLQVVEACSGIRYLFPLVSLALLCAYLYRAATWKRILVFLSSIPISILLNGFRIGAIGVLVDAYGQAAAEGFAHFFEGWVFFVTGLALLFSEMYLLARIQPVHGEGAWLNGFAQPPHPQGSAISLFERRRPFRGLSVPLLCTLIVAGALAVISTFDVARGETVPSRLALMDFPLEIGTWRGTTVAMEKQYLDVLKLDDYFLADYTLAGKQWVNVYVAYYLSPLKGRSAHSPKTCIPGGGWEIRSFETVPLAGVPEELRVNRVLIQKGDQKQMVYYWFKQRNRSLTNEYVVKFFYFWDALLTRRSDGGLIRLVTPVLEGESETVADSRLTEMAGLVRPLLSQYVPD